MVTDLEKGSDAEGKGLSAGDVIIEARGKPVVSAQDVAHAADTAAKDKRNTLLIFMAHCGDAGDTRFVAVKLKK